MKNNFSKLIICLLVLSISGFSFTVKSQTLTREQINLDEDLYVAENFKDFAEPKTITIVPIDAVVNSYELQSQDWFAGIYYYMAGRLGLGDIQFHYGVSHDGLVMQGIKNGDEQKVFVEGIDEHSIMIGYLKSTLIDDFDQPSIDPLINLLAEICNKNSIDPQLITVRNLNYELKDKVFKMTSSQASGRFAISLDGIKQQVAKKYSPKPKVYSLNIESITLPTSAVNPFDEVVVKIKVRNTSQFSIYKDTNSEVFAAQSDKKNSLFYVYDQWLSGYQSELMTEGQAIRPNEEAEFNLKLNIPLYFGEQVEEFELVNLDGVPFGNTKFQIKVNVNRIEGNVVEVQSTETGSLNVRDRASGFGQIVQTILPGQRFIEQERTPSGWVKIDLGKGVSGWVSAKYVKRI